MNRSYIRAIKYVVFLTITLFLSVFIVGEVRAGFNESFENYEIGPLAGQGDWYGFNRSPATWISWFVSTENASEGLKGIKSHATATDYASEKWWATTTGSGIFSFDFYAEHKPNKATISFCTGFTICEVEVEIGAGGVLDKTNTKIEFNNIVLAENYALDVWHRISVFYDFENNLTKASFDFGAWSTTTPLNQNYFNRFIIRGFYPNDFKPLFIDSFTNEGECNSTCVYCDFSGCQDYEGACIWNYDENQCQVNLLGIPELELPEVEDCSGLGITDRILCEIKNFFYRLFVPSSSKITELKNTLDLTKTKFPYNYILGFRDFFVYLKDNTSEGVINFGILNQNGTIDLSFWNTTTTFAGINQSFSTILKTFFRFLIILIFGIWCFSFIKRIFK